jgi:hypothetical protein
VRPEAARTVEVCGRDRGDHVRSAPAGELHREVADAALTRR